MPANNELSDLEQHVYDYIKDHPGLTAVWIWRSFDNSRCAPQKVEVDQAISDLVQKNYIVASAEMPLRYSVVGGIK